MPLSVLIPLDGSEIANRILIQLSPLLTRPEADVTLLRVLSLDASRRPAEVASVKASLDAAQGRLTALGARAHYKILVGEAAEQVAAFARQLAPTLVALSAHGETAVRGRRGRIAERLLETCSAPILLTNPFDFERAEVLSLRKIMVPFDGTPDSAKVLPLAADIARVFGSELVLLHVTEIPEIVYPPVKLQIPEAEAKPLHEVYRTKLGVPSLRVRVSLGAAAEAIIEAATEEKADLVALTSHGSSRRSRTSPLGPVAERVIRSVTCPLLLCRTGPPLAPEPTDKPARFLVGT
jgi:nucleotide-binding universal stress UspA family protein